MERSGTSTRWTGLLALTLGVLSAAPDPAVATTAQEVEEFVHATYIEGVPYEQASQLAPEVALPILNRVLSERAEEQYWANAAIAIGMIGDDRGADMLITFVTRPEVDAKVSRAQTVAKTSAVMALGYIVNKTGNRRALDFLKASVDPRVWDERNLAWIGEFHRTGAERNNQLAMMAVLGLGVSGNAEAAQTLRSLKEAPRTEQLRALRRAVPEIEGIADDALKANEAISSGGIRNYYIKTRPKETPGDGTRETKPESAREVTRPPVAGESLREPQAGEVLKQAESGVVLLPPRAGQMVRQPQPGEVIEQK